MQSNPIIRLLTLPLRIAIDVVGGLPAVLVPVLAPLLSRAADERESYPFLSEEWVDAARRIRDDYAGKAAPPPVVRINQIVTGVPFGSGELLSHTDTTSGDLDMDHGHLDEPDLTVTIGYDVAKALLVDMDVQAAMQAFMRGEIKVEGDITKLMALQTAQVDPIAFEAATRIKAITQ